jgi:hypothetical protein
MTVDKSHYLVDSLKGISSAIPKANVPMVKGMSPAAPTNTKIPSKNIAKDSKATNVRKEFHK